MDTKNIRKTLVLTELQSEKSGRFFFIVAYICYFLYCATRNYYPQALAEIVPSGIFTKDIAGIVSSAYMIGYGAGMFINGYLAEKVQPFFYITLSFGLSAGTSALMYAYSLSLPPTPAPTLIIPFIVIWGIAGYAQSGVWPILIRLTTAIMPAKKSANACSHLYISSIIGGIGTYLISQQILRMFNWRTLFLVSALSGVFLTLFFYFTTVKIKRSCVSYTLVTPDKTEKKQSGNAEHSIFKLLMMSGGIFILAVVILNCFAYRGLADMVPTMLVEQFGVGADFSVMVSTLLPICTVAGAYFGRFLYHRVFHSEVRTTACCMLFAAGVYALIAIVGFVSLGFVMATIMVVAVMTSCASTMCVGLVPLRFARYSRAGSLAGFFNGAGFVGNSASALAVGFITENLGWNSAIIVLTVFMALGGLLALLVVRKWRKFVHN